MANITPKHTNVRLLEAAERELKTGDRVDFFGEQYRKKRMKLMSHIFRQVEGEPERDCTMKHNIPTPWINPNRRVGQPRKNWIEETMGSMWEELHEPGGALYGMDEGEMDIADEDKIQTLHLAATLYAVG